VVAPDDVEAAPLIVEAAFQTGERERALQAAKLANTAGRSSRLLGDVAWRSGDFEGVYAAYSAASPSDLDAGALERLALSAMAVNRSPPLLRSAPPGLRHFFASPPRNVREALRFAEGVAAEAQFIRERISR
jgi:hypothetical protein